MAEGLSERLRNLLLELGLCTQSDLRRAGRQVRRLSRDLPAFDSVWLDALVQMARLSPFQARLLESDQPGRIRLGPCVLINRIGGGPLGETFLAHRVGGNELCAIKVLGAADRLTVEADERLQRVIAEVKTLKHPSLVAPHACDRADGRCVLVSRHIGGPTLADMLVRRGRYPAGVVIEIGRQLIEGLAALAACGHAHGDIRAANVRLTAGGVAVLVDAAVRPVLDAELSVHSGLPPDRYDGVAPELIGTGRAPDVASDIYALGCLLWHLLAGRPPFPGGDPLAKLAAHQTRKIDDVRKWAPDTSPALALALARWTAADPTRRPASWEEIGRQWGPPRSAGRRVLRSFLHRFHTPTVPPSLAVSRTTRWTFAAALLFALSGAVLFLGDRGAKNMLLSWTSRYVPFDRAGDTATGDINATKGQSGTSSKFGPGELSPAGLDLPPPDARGVIRLDRAGPYRPADIAAVGALSIIGTSDTPPEIVLTDKPLKLWAESITLRNLRIKWLAPYPQGGKPPAALLLVQSQHLEFEHCVFDAPARALSESPSDEKIEPPVAVAWRLLDPRDLRGGTGTMRDSVFLGDGASIYLAAPVRQWSSINCLKIGSGPLVHLAAGPSANRDIRLEVSSTTCRAAGPLLLWNVPADWSGKGRVQIDSNAAVFDIARGESLVEFVTAQFRREMATAVQMTGVGSLTSPEMQIAAWMNPTDGTVQTLDAAQIQIEGLLAGPFEFRGPISAQLDDAELRSCEAPRQTAKLPGVSSH